MKKHDRRLGISVIIPVYNRRDQLAKLLLSLRYGDSVPDEVIVVDDGSTEDSAIVAESYGACVVRLDERRGPSNARNQGAKLARGEILMFLDSDTVANKDTVANVYAAFAEHRDVEAIVGVYDRRPADTGWFTRFRALDIWSYLHRDGSTAMRQVDQFGTHCGAIYRAVFERTGGFQSQYDGIEDWILGYKIASRVRIWLCLDVVVQHAFGSLISSIWKIARQSYLYGIVLFERKRFDNTCATAFEAGRCALTGLVLVMAVLGILQVIPWHLTLILLCAFAVSHYRLIATIVRYERYWFLPCSLIYKYLLSLAIVCGGVFGLVRTLVLACIGRVSRCWKKMG